MQSTILQIALSILLTTCAIAGEASSKPFPVDIENSFNRFTTNTKCRLHKTFRTEPVAENASAIRIFEGVVFTDKPTLITEPNLVSSFRAAKIVYVCTEYRASEKIGTSASGTSLILIDGNGNLLDILSRRLD